MTKELTKEFVRKHLSAVILILFFMATLLSSLECIEVALHREDYTKMTGTIIEKYSKRYGYGKKRRTKHYLSVSFVYEGETLYVNGLRASFWEKEGDTVSFYMDSDGNVVKGSFIFSLDFILMLSLLVIHIIKTIMNGDPIFIKPSIPKGTVIDDYDFTTSQTTYHSTYGPGAKDTFINRMLYQSEAMDIPINNVSQATFNPDLSTGTALNESENSTDSHQKEQEASYQDIPVIQIPEDYL